MYHFIDRLHTLYGLLQDEQSKEVFQARFAIDMEPSMHNIDRLVSLGRIKTCSSIGWNESQKDILQRLNRENKKIILYGTSHTGQSIARILNFEHIDFYGFCGRGADRFPDGLHGKPVLSPDELVAHGDEYYVVIAVVQEKNYAEVFQFLKKNNYPEDHILDWASQPTSLFDEKQYLDFPELYRRGTVFIDGGCYDCENSYRFAEWCGGEYSSIIAFEPDPDNYAECCKKTQNAPLPNFQLVNAGLSSKEGTAVFDARNGMGSRIISAELPAKSNMSPSITENKVSIRTAAIDDIVGDRTVGFIKMDIEGAELDALHGAKNTIIRDKPLLAICVYHLQGDLFAIMDYLHQLLPEYRFLLRHYSADDRETVLYASADL